MKRSSEHRLIETTKRYARLADGNVGNFQCNARTVITVRAYSVDWLLHLHIRVILTTSIRRRGTSAPRFHSVNGYKSDTSDFNENDSTVTFFPIDNKKLTSLNPNSKDWVEYSVPNHPEKKERFYIGRKYEKLG